MTLCVTITSAESAILSTDMDSMAIGVMKISSEALESILSRQASPSSLASFQPAQLIPTRSC